MIRKFLSKIRNDCNLKKLQSNGMKLGKNCIIARNAEIDYSHCWLIEIGNNVNITTKCVILAHDASTKIDLGYAKIGKVIVEDNVFIGAGSIVLPNTHIGKNTIIGAGSVVCGEIESDSVYVGSPAKKIMDKQEYLDKHRRNISNNKNVFDKSYTINFITQDKKEEMKNKLKDNIGYVE